MQQIAEQRVEAINILKQVTSLYKGTLQEHQAIQSALDLLIKLSDPANNLQIHEFIPADLEKSSN